MDMRVKELSAVCVLLCSAFGLFLSMCTDHGTDPKPEGPKDYAVFFGDYTVPPYELYRYHVVSGKLDSTTSQPQSLISPTAVSADGKRLYWYDGTVMDAETFDVLTPLPHRGYVAPSPDNQLLAVCDTDLFILRTSDFSVVYHDTDAVASGTFSGNSKRFYGKKAAVGDCYPMYKLDLEQANQVTYSCIKGGMGLEPLVISPDETKLYLYRKYATFLCSFDVYDLTLDSTTFSEPLIPGGGTLAQTPDGKDVYFTNPGDLISGPPPPYSLAVYHVETMKIDTVMDWGLVCWSDSSQFLGYKHIVITADGRWLMGTTMADGTIIRRNLQDSGTTTRCVFGAWLKFPRTQNGL
ncbi:MAG: hypothetical protein AB1644_13850 [Candidatus Zixiibacteriota bacterium]